MKKLLCLCSGMMFCLTVNADFCATNLPSLVGEYNCSYFSTNNLNVPAMLTLTTNSGGGLTPVGLGPVWDFSQLQQSQETVLRTDIIAPADGMDGGSFSDTAYAEQDTLETPASTNQIAWRYYSITNQGRLYYGSYVPNTGADGLALFEPPTLDIPVTVTNGQTWSRSTSWNSTVYSFPIYYEFSDTATVDAQGTLILPNVGAFPALRVHEIHSYTGLLDGPDPYETETNQYYYWLVPNLGVAAQITIYGNITIDGFEVETPLFTNSVERMYYASYYTNPPPIIYNFAPDNLHIQSQNGAIALNWIPLTNSINNLVSTNYQVQAIGSLSGTNWQVLGLTSGTNWSDASSPTQRFYRVVGFP